MEENLRQLRKHILATYFVLRVVVGVVALAFPLVLWLGGLANPKAALSLQSSISAYYHTPLRDVFVGVMFVVGSCLVVYRGFTEAENWILNAAGVLALGVALLPTDLTCNPGDAACLERAGAAFSRPQLHVACALLFFACIAIVCMLLSRSSLDLMPDRKMARRYQVGYHVLGGLMILLPLCALGAAYLIERDLPPTEHHWTYAAEFAAIWVFGVYWIVKSREIKASDADTVVALRELGVGPNTGKMEEARRRA